MVTWDEFHAKNLDQSKEAFFETGREHIIRALHDNEKMFGLAGRRSALDFGCGVGRLLVPLAGLFERVDGVDVSPSMLKEARATLSGRGIKNFELLNSDDCLTSILEKKYDFVHSHIVFQHIPKKRGYALIDRLLSHVGPDGCFHIHVPIKRLSSPMKRFAHFVKHQVPFAYIGFNLFDRKHLLTPTMQMNLYDVGMLMEIFRKHGFETVACRSEVHVVRSGSCLTVSFFSRRPRSA